ncbi:MAG TPA: LysR substrate-binding domain-containing protein [Dokdonella sp.]
MRRLPGFVLLRAFEAAARLRSFALAARELHLTPSAISHQIRDLEEHFGRRLFVRANRRVEPTVEGLRLYESVARAFDVLESACAGVALAPAATSLVVHSAPSFAVKWLAPRLPDFMRVHAGATLHLRSGAEPVDLTREREVDVGIAYGSAPDFPGVVAVALGTERIAPMCAPALLDAALSPAELLGRVPLIESQLSRIGWADWFARNGLRPPPGARPSFDRAALAISAAVDAVGAILESERLAERELERGELVVLGADAFAPLRRETHFVYFRSIDARSAKVAAFVRWLFERLGLGDAPLPAAEAVRATPR